MKRLLWLVLAIGLTGCLDYEIRVETVVAEDGSIHRVIRLRERSDKHETWRMYARAVAPFTTTGSDKDGYVAEAKLPAGAHASGLRVRDQQIEKDGEAPAATRIHEGRFQVHVDDIGIGKLYRYYEVVELGFDLEAARVELDFGLEIGMATLVHALEILEPERDFAPVLTEAQRVLIPEVRTALLTIHSQASLIFQSGFPLRERTPLADLERDSRFRIIVAEFARLGVSRKRGSDAPTTLQEYIDGAEWTFRETLWKRVLAPLKVRDQAERAALNKSLYERLWGERTEENPEVWERAFAALIPKAKEKEVEERLRKLAVAALGALVTNDLFSQHDFTISVRLPGQLLRTNGDLVSAPTARWRVDSMQIDNPRVHATSFLPSKEMLGVIDNVDALLRFADSMREATDEEREALMAHLGRKKLPKEDRSCPQVKLLREALRGLPGDE